MWLWWLAAKMTGPSIRSRCSRPFDADPGEQRAPSGRIQVGRLTRRIARAGQRPVPRRETHRLGRRRVAAPAAARPARGARRRRARRRTRPRRCASGTRPRARPSARRVRASSGQLFDRRAGGRSSRPAYLASSAASAVACRPRRRAARRPPFTQSRMAARFSLRVPSVRGSSGSGHTSARRIRW